MAQCPPLEATLPCSTHAEASQTAQQARDHRQPSQKPPLEQTASRGPAHGVKLIAPTLALPTGRGAPSCSPAARNSPAYLLLRRPWPELPPHRCSLVAQSCSPCRRRQRSCSNARGLWARPDRPDGCRSGSRPSAVSPLRRVYPAGRARARPLPTGCMVPATVPGRAQSAARAR